MLVAGCRVEENKHGDGKDVSITTPFGGMQVKTNDADVLGATGLAAYPGAQAVKEKDNGSADVNMSFGSFQMRVKAASYRTDDAPDKVEAFYRKELHRFGDLIACRDGQAVGSPAVTAEGLTCDNQHNGHVTLDGDSGKHQLELKAGSQQHQHIVGIDGDGGGTKFSLVAMDLPGNVSFGDGDGHEHRQ
jgi:hypothetical protein